jgi:hypothetical protein
MAVGLFIVYPCTTQDVTHPQRVRNYTVDSREDGISDGMLKVGPICSHVCYICVTYSSHQGGLQRLKTTWSLYTKEQRVLYVVWPYRVSKLRIEKVIIQ